MGALQDGLWFVVPEQPTKDLTLYAIDLGHIHATTSSLWSGPGQLISEVLVRLCRGCRMAQEGAQHGETLAGRTKLGLTFVKALSRALVCLPKVVSSSIDGCQAN